MPRATAAGILPDLIPFAKGPSLLAWAAPGAWIPLLIMLEIWRDGRRYVPLRYESDDWDIVFPIGMYTVGTYALALALRLDFLLAIPAVGVYVSLLVWALVTIAMIAQWLRAPSLDAATPPGKKRL